jgi:hypothetical protein
MFISEISTVISLPKELQLIRTTELFQQNNTVRKTYETLQ